MKLTIEADLCTAQEMMLKSEIEKLFEQVFLKKPVFYKPDVSGRSEQLPPQETALWKEMLGYNAELQMQLGRSSQDERVIKLAEKYVVTRR